MKAIAVSFATIAALGVSPLDAANLIPNATFDSDIAGWSFAGPSQIAWDPVDEEGSLLSGSLRLEGEGSSGSAQVCLIVTPGTIYAFGGSAFMPDDGSDAFQRAYLTVIWDANLHCQGPNLEFSSAIAEVRATGAWGTVEGWAQAPPGAVTALFRLSHVGPPGERVAFFDNAFFVNDTRCVGTATAMCLNQDRFLVTAQWEKPDGEQGFGRAVGLTDDSGYFWFFNSDNVELVTKLLDACGTSFQTYWFFAAGLTNVYTLIEVHDTLGESDLMYENPQGMPFEAIQDTGAFNTCP